jgi:hypothetical protein
MAAEKSSADSPRPRWRGSSPAAAGDDRRARRKGGRRLFVPLLLLLALLGAAVAWLYLIKPPPTPYFLTMPVREYKFQQFANPLAQRDGMALRRHFAGSPSTYDKQAKELLLQELGGLHKKDDRPVIVHVSALAVGREDGVYVLPADARPGATSTWLPLREVLTKLADCPAPHRLLILDVRQPLADPRLGIVDEDVAGAVIQEVEKANPPFLVWCPCSAGQVPLTCDEAALSVFAYYLNRELQHLGERRLAIKELAARVGARVDRWAQENRSARQTPVLLGRGEDFTLVTTQPSEDLPEPDLAYPKWLASRWAERDAWAAGAGRETAPAALRRLEAILLWAEAHWPATAGPDKESEEVRLKKDVGEARRKVNQTLELAPLPPAPRARSLALMPMDGGHLAKTQDAADKLLAALGGEADTDPKEWAKVLEKAKAAYLTAVKDFTFPEMAGAAFEVLSGDQYPPTKTLVHETWALLKGTKGLKNRQAFVETLFLDRLDARGSLLEKRNPKAGWIWREDLVHQGLATLRQEQAAIAAVASFPQALPWVKELFQSGDLLRRDGEKQFFNGRPTQWKEAGKKLFDAEGAYGEALRQTAVLRVAQQSLQEALAALPDYAQLIAELAAPTIEEEAEWNKARWAATHLAEKLQGNHPQFFPEVQEFGEKLRAHLAALQRALADRLVRLERFKQTGGNGLDYQEMQTLLRCARLSASQRQKCWEAARALGRRLHDKTRAKDDAEEDKAPPGGPAPKIDEMAQTNRFNRAARRARMFIELLQLGGLEKTKDLQEALNKAENRPGHAAWTALGNKLYEAWTERVSDRLKETADKQPEATDRLGRLQPPFEESLLRGERFPHWSANPAAFLRRLRETEFRQWLGRRYREESQRFGDSPESLGYQAFFADAAQEFGQ